jgi:pimeloyl-ACP methyl ester carboxylesterase
MPDSQRVDLPDVSLHYWDWPGNRPPIVCLHPSSHYGRIWEWVAEQLAPIFRVLAPEQRGHGESGRPASGRGAEGLKHALDDLRPYAARISCPVLILRAAASAGVRR